MEEEGEAYLSAIKHGEHDLGHPPLKEILPQYLLGGRDLR